MTEPLRVRLNEERHAEALARELGGFARFAEQSGEGDWEVTVAGSLGERDIVRVLNAVRRALGGDSAASARVFLNGREYQLQGE